MKQGLTVYRPQAGNLYDWYGQQLKPELLQALTAGHIVRIQVNHLEAGYSEAIYVQLTEVTEDHLTGIVLDTHRHFFEGEMIYIEDGETISFVRECVMEIPLEWAENETLTPLAQFTGLGRIATGIFPSSPEDNHDNSNH